MKLICVFLATTLASEEIERVGLIKFSQLNFLINNSA